MTPDRRLAALAVAAFVVAAGLMVLFESVVTRIIGVILLLAFIVLGVFAIASPRWLAETDDAETPS